jgi:AcrR family transcriptional regulator
VGAAQRNRQSVAGELWSSSPQGPTGRAIPRAQVAEIQRSRLLAAAVLVVDERGYGNTTVAHITSRARVSRRTFYELFANREECLAALLEDAVGQIRSELPAAELGQLEWREWIRVGLGVVLAFLDREPALARVCIVESARGGLVVLERREEILRSMAAAVDAGRLESTRAMECSPLTAEGLVGAATAIVYARLFKGERTPLMGLWRELMGMIVLPYLGVAAARREQSRPVSRQSAALEARGSRRPMGDPLEGVQMRMTYRTARVLEGVAGHPRASNRAIAQYAGIQDQGQVSKLLARLQRLGLLANSGDGHSKGEPNAWSLTIKGERIAQSIRLRAPGERQVA